MNNPIVTHHGKQYTVRKLACGYIWRFSEIETPNNGFNKDRDQMLAAGFRYIVEMKS